MDGTINDVSFTDDKDCEDEYKDCHVFSFETKTPEVEELPTFHVPKPAPNPQKIRMHHSRNVSMRSLISHVHKSISDQKKKEKSHFLEENITPPSL